MSGLVRCVAGLVTIVILLGSTTGVIAQSATPMAASGQQFTPIIPRVSTAPQWFPGSDGQVHLVYELFLTNAINVPVTVTGVTILDTARGTVIATLEGASLDAAMSTLTAYTDPTTTLQPSTIGVVWLDILIAGPAEVPTAISHALTVRVPPGMPIPESSTFTGAASAVDLRAPIVLGAPLVGANWAAIGSCCDGPHRRAFQPINGQLFLAQRFAIDFNLLDADHRLSQGDPTRNASYPSFGQPVVAVADATVVQAVDGLADQTPGSPPVGITLETADGNHVILDLGNGSYAFYAHLRAGSVAVNAGDIVRQGDLIGELGNTGSSDGAHLHFHVMDGPSALAANGLPYVFADYAVTGQLPPLADILPQYEAQQPIPVDTTIASRQVATFPLGGTVLTFPDAATQPPGT